MPLDALLDAGKRSVGRCEGAGRAGERVAESSEEEEPEERDGGDGECAEVLIARGPGSRRRGAAGTDEERVRTSVRQEFRPRESFNTRFSIRSNWRPGLAFLRATAGRRGRIQHDVETSAHLDNHSGNDSYNFTQRTSYNLSIAPCGQYQKGPFGPASSWSEDDQLPTIPNAEPIPPDWMPCLPRISSVSGEKRTSAIGRRPSNR